jgi:hypothetical protein
MSFEFVAATTMQSGVSIIDSALQQGANANDSTSHGSANVHARLPSGHCNSVQPIDQQQSLEPTGMYHHEQHANADADQHGHCDHGPGHAQQ